MAASSKNNLELRQYLLGLLTESKRETVDRRLLTDSEFNEELETTEDELVDEYVSGELNAQERKQFESHFLIGSERQNKVRLARSWQSLPQNSNAATSGRFAFLSSFREASASWRTALVVTFSLAGLLGLSSVWFAYRLKRPTSTVPQVIGVTLTSGASRGLEQSPRARLTTAPFAAIHSRSQLRNDHDGLCPTGRSTYPTPNATKLDSRSRQNRGRNQSSARPVTDLLRV